MADRLFKGVCLTALPPGALGGVFFADAFAEAAWGKKYNSILEGVQIESPTVSLFVALALFAAAFALMHRGGPHRPA